MIQYDDEVLDTETEHSHRMEEASIEPTYVTTASPVDQLERYGRWLSSIPRDDIIVLRETPEYHDFLRAFERLGDAHRRVISMNRSTVSMDEGNQPPGQVPRSFVAPDPFFSFTNNFMQHLTADDVILRVFEFLECHSLIRMALTCSRFRQLAYRSATQRTYDVANSRQLNSVMQLLRAKEQIDGVGNGMNDSHVRVPILLLSRRVLVTNSGDPEMNGVYFCTGSNGNGFVFTKPRFPEQRVQRNSVASTDPDSSQEQAMQAPMQLRREQEARIPHARGGDANMGVAAGGPLPIDQVPDSRFESEVAQPGQLLRCSIAKRFSNEVSQRLGWECLPSNPLKLKSQACCLLFGIIDNSMVSQQGSHSDRSSQWSGCGRSFTSILLLGKTHGDWGRIARCMPVS